MRIHALAEAREYDASGSSLRSSFSQTYKIGNIAIIAKFFYSQIFTISFFIYTMCCYM